MTTIARVKFPFTARHDDELDVRFNDLIRIVTKETEVEGWSDVEFNGKQGKLPTSYFQPIPSYDGAVGTAAFSFKHPKEPETGQFLIFEVGDEILVTDRANTGWCIGIYKSRIGLYPEGYVTFESKAKFSELEEYLVKYEDKDFPYATVLCNAVDVSSTETMARDMIILFEKHNKVYELICAVIDNEINQTINEGTLFRKNSLASHMMSQYARLVGKEYLRDTLGPLINSIIEGNIDYEIDPHKIDPNANIDRNIEALTRAAQDFLLGMMSSVNKFPMALRQICKYLQNAVIVKFPEARRKVIGGFFFLRLICPAVVSPDGFGIAENVDDKSRRCLVLVSKIMQTLSNGVKFGVKEEYMIPMNQFITQNLENSHFILDKLAMVHPDIPTERLPELTPDEEQRLASRIHLACSLCKSKYIKELRTIGKDENEVTNIASIIVRLGPTPQRQVKSSIPKPQIAQAVQARGTEMEQKRKTKSKEKEEKRALKQREKEKRKIDSQKPSIPPPSGTLLIKSQLSRKSNKTSWKKKYFCLYSNSTKIYAFNNPEDPLNTFVDHIELAPSYEVTVIGRTKQGWEFAVRTLHSENNFVCPEEDDMRCWVASLDRRKREIMMPEDDKKNKLALLECLEQKMKGYVEERIQTKEKLKNTTDPAQIAILTTKIEELVICMETLQRSIDAASSTVHGN